MVVNVKGRNIHIDDELAKNHETLYKEPVDDMLILSYLSAHFLGNLDRVFKTTPERELSRIVTDIMKTENTMVIG